MKFIKHFCTNFEKFVGDINIKRILNTRFYILFKIPREYNIELEGLSEAELSMVKLESVREVLFQALLLDDVKFEDGKMYAELCTVYLLI